jgi:hypothetical protein
VLFLVYFLGPSDVMYGGGEKKKTKYI